MREAGAFRASYESRGAIKRRLQDTGLNFFSSGVYLTVSYLLVKLMYAAVALLQIFVLNYMFRDDYYGGLGFFAFFFGPHNWKLKERFPVMTLCKFQVYILNDQQTHVSGRGG
jgi:hypothetical protein